MPIQHRRIPVLPDRPCVHPIADPIFRSYSTGRQNFSRAFQGQILALTITTKDPLIANVKAVLTTTLNSAGGKIWTKIPFVQIDERTLKCCIIPSRPGLHSFRAEFSLDGGTTWLRDTVPDAWVLVDPPQVDALRLYTLISTVSGSLADWSTDLRRIRDMGFNAVHLLPVTAMDTSESPYSARDLFSIDPSYLREGCQRDGLSQLEEFIEKARSLDLRLCFDLVLNHVGVHSTMARRAPDWIVPDQNQPDGLQRAWYWSSEGRRTWNDLVLINYEHPSEAIRSEIWAYMIEYALFWTKYAHDTGGLVRFDNLHRSDPDFVQALTAARHSKYPEVGVLAEYFTDDLTLLNKAPAWGLNLLLATPWEYKFVPQLRVYLKNIHRISGQIRYLMPITSHDCGAPAQEFGSADSTIPRYVAAALLGTGATGIVQGVEFGERERIDFIGRKPKISQPDVARFAPFLSRVNAILADHPVFCWGNNCRFVDEEHPAVIAAFRRDRGTPAFGFLVVCNFDTRNPQRITVDLAPELGTEGPFLCDDLLSGEAHVFANPCLDLLLPACSAQVLRFPRNRDLAGKRKSPDERTFS